MVDLNYNFECDWLIGLSNNRLSNNNLARKLVENVIISYINIQLLFVIYVVNFSVLALCQKCV